MRFTPLKIKLQKKKINKQASLTQGLNMSALKGSENKESEILNKKLHDKTVEF